MKTKATSGLIVLFACAASGVLAASEPPATTPDGLELVKGSKLDLVYRRPDADLSGYARILIDPVQVAFKKQWTRDFSRITPAERETIRQTLADEARKVFIEELQEKGGYQIVDAPGPDVLRVTAFIVELYINAPDTGPGRSRTFAISSGEMMLVAELRDSESGAVLARATDRERGRESATFQWQNRQQNLADARLALRKWAAVLRTALDSAKAKSG